MKKNFKNLYKRFRSIFPLLSVFFSKRRGAIFAEKTKDFSSQLLEEVLFSCRRSLIAAAVFSGIINLLALSGSLFMLQVYDRVLPAHSLQTLVALIILVLVLYAFMILLDIIRARLFARIGHYLDINLQKAVFNLTIKATLPGHTLKIGSPIQDLEQIKMFLTSGGPVAFFDLPWMPIYLGFLFMLHRYIGYLGITGGVLLVFLAWLSYQRAAPHQKLMKTLAYENQVFVHTIRNSSETIIPLSMSPFLRASWITQNEKVNRALLKAGDRLIFYGNLSKFFRMALQSLALSLGAYLVVSGEATGGIMIASSILLGKALAPVELAISNWRGFVAAKEAYLHLRASLSVSPPLSVVTVLPLPKQTVTVSHVSLGVLGDSFPLLSHLDFRLEAGEVLAVVGPNGAGKSTLARAIVGMWPIMKGSVRFDGATLDQWDEEKRGQFIGYMPQNSEMFAGGIGQNIARFCPDASSDEILKAADLAGVSSFVKKMRHGFDYALGHRGEGLSIGQKQKIALARALFRDPFLLVLDEPCAALDAEGEQALISAIESVRKRSGIVFIITYRARILQIVDKILVLGERQQQAFGTRQEILERLVSKKSTSFQGVALR